MIERILATKRQEVEALGHRRPGARGKAVLPFVPEGDVSIIAELKAKSPSGGHLGEIDDGRIKTYGRYAKAISVVTDGTYFGGSFGLLARVAGETGLPVLCKDFIIDERQIDFAYGAGADMVLLIARVLGGKELGGLYGHAAGLGLACLVEVHDDADLEAAQSLSPRMMGVNARDLDTLCLDGERQARLLSRLTSPVRVAESGIRSHRDIERLASANAFLVGEALMRSPDVASTFEGLIHGED